MDEGYNKAGDAGWMRYTIKLGCWVDEGHNKAGDAGWMRDTIKRGVLGG